MKAKIIRNGFIALAVLVLSSLAMLFISLKGLVFFGIVSAKNADVIFDAAVHFLWMGGVYALPVFLLSLVLSLTQGNSASAEDLLQYVDAIEVDELGRKRVLEYRTTTQGCDGYAPQLAIHRAATRRSRG